MFIDINEGFTSLTEYTREDVIGKTSLSLNTGMGLAMIHGIVKGCGGEIAVESKVGDGTIFNVYLPIMEKLEAYSHNSLT
jgi:sensor histidine kinase regulating citrate/malate metabolism